MKAKNLLMMHPMQRGVVGKHLHTPDTGWYTCRVPVQPWHRSEYPYSPDTGQNTCIALTQVRVPAQPWHRPEYLHSPDTGQNTCIALTQVRVPAQPWHRSGYLHSPDTDQGTCTALTQVRIPAGYLHSPDTGQNTCRVLAQPWHESKPIRTRRSIAKILLLDRDDSGHCGHSETRAIITAAYLNIRQQSPTHRAPTNNAALTPPAIIRILESLVSFIDSVTAPSVTATLGVMTAPPV